MLGQILLRLARPQEAARALADASAAMPGNLSIEVALGVALVQSGEPAAALAPLEHAVKVAPVEQGCLECARPRAGRDRRRRRRRRCVRARARRRAAIHARARQLVRGARQCRTPDDAIRIATAATERHPDDLGAWFNLGHVQMNELNSRRRARRVRALRRAAARHSCHAHQPRARRAVVRTTRRRGSAISPGARHHSGDVNARFGLATVLLKRRRSEEGWALYAQGRTGASQMITRRATDRPWDGRRIARGHAGRLRRLRLRRHSPVRALRAAGTRARAACRHHLQRRRQVAARESLAAWMRSSTRSRISTPPLQPAR